MAESAAADWLVVGPEGTGTLDIRATFHTHEPAIIFDQYMGRVDVSQGSGEWYKLRKRWMTTEAERARHATSTRVAAVGLGSQPVPS